MGWPTSIDMLGEDVKAGAAQMARCRASQVKLKNLDTTVKRDKHEKRGDRGFKKTWQKVAIAGVEELSQGQVGSGQNGCQLQTDQKRKTTK